VDLEVLGGYLVHQEDRLLAASRHHHRPVVAPGGPGDGDGVEHRGMDASLLPRRHAGDHVLYSGHLGYRHGHERRGQERHATRGLIRSDRPHGHLPLPRDDARCDLFLEVDERLALHPREPPRVVPADLDGLAQFPVDGVRGAPDLLSETRKSGGSQPSSSREYALTSSMPPRSMRESISETRSLISGGEPFAGSSLGRLR
jgi:hypothetical protein